MKQITTRSLATAAITGALVVGTAGIAQADDSRTSESSSQSESSTEFGAPIEFGGITLNNESSTSNSQDDAFVDDDGDSTSSSSSSTADRAQTFQFGSFAFDPTFIYEAAQAQRAAEQVADDGDDVQRSEQSESASRVDGSAPATIGGAEGQLTQDDTSDNSVTTRDDDETDTQSDSSESHSEQNFDIEDTTLDPLLGSENGEKDSLVESILN